MITRKIHRAFPELDRYSDEQCDRFVRAAGRGFFRNLFVFGACITVGAATLLCGITAAAFLEPLASRAIGDDADLRDIAAGLILFCAVVASPFLGYWMRDWLLIRRIRTILRKRGLCTDCSYNLVGLPVVEGSVVVCPECGKTTKVDPALGELTLTSAGNGVFEPSESAVPDAPPFWTPAKKRFLKRSLIAAMVLVFVVFPTAWGTYEWFLHHQAAVARRERPGTEALGALVRKLKPAETNPGAPSAWEAFDRAVALRTRADSEVWNNGQLELVNGAEVNPDFSLLYPRPRGGRGSRNNREYERACAELARRMLDVYRAEGVYAQLDLVAVGRDTDRAFQVDAGGPLVGVLLPELGAARGFVRMNGARMKLATDASDLAEFSSALESSLAMGRLISRQPFLISALVAAAVDAATFERINELLETHPDPAWLRATHEAMERQLSRPGVAFPFESERIMSLDTVAWTFSEPSRVRFGRFSGAIAPYFGGTNIFGRIGTYAANRDAVNQLFDDLIARAQTPAYARTSSNAPQSRSGLALVDLLSPAFTRTVAGLDQQQWKLVEIRLLVALERYFADHHAYPPDLSSLVPHYIPAIPVDPRTGTTVGYSLGDPAAAAGNPFDLFPVLVDPDGSTLPQPPK